MTAIVDELRERIEQLEAENEELRAELSEYRDRNEHDKATIRQDVSEAKEIAESNTIESDGSDESEPGETPMHQLIRAGEAGVLGSVTPSIRRAKAIAENFVQWARKAPGGLVITEGLKRLVETATGESLFWKQIERACNALAETSKGTIAFKNSRRKGWMLVAQPDDHRLRSLSAATG
jgi:predicted phage gp36 major capsid-like protein